MRLYLCKRCKERIVTLGAARIGRCPACSNRLAEVWMPTGPRAAPDTFAQDGQAYASIDDFFAADSRRLVSREVDFGLYWREHDGEPTYRAAWVEDTGELYVVQAGPPQAGGGHLEVLAIGDRASVETALDGWAGRCRQPASLDWLRGRAGRIRAEGQPLPRVSAPDRAPPRLA